MSTTDAETTDAPSDVPDVVDIHRLRRDRELYDEYRSLMRVSPQNEAAACETVAECRDVINRELYRDEPRDWVVAIVNKRMQEVAGGD